MPGYGAAGPQKEIFGAQPFVDPEADDDDDDDTGLAHLPLSGKDPNVDFSRFMVGVTIVLPVAIYVVTSYVLSFELHYDASILSWSLVGLALMPVIVLIFVNKNQVLDMLGFKVITLEKEDFIEQKTTKWILFLCGLCFVAWVMGITVGLVNFNMHMKQFYDMTYLNTAASVDASKSGAQYIDTGRFLFQPGSYINVQQAMGLKIGKTYCAAPVIDPSVPAAQRMYDFWAVGTDCCSAIQPQENFHCGEIANNYAHAGMRLMDSADRAMYRMAVQEAEATYKINAARPVFVLWMQDPSRQMTAYYESGNWMFWAGVWSFFVLMAFASFSAGLCFSKAVTKSYPCRGVGFVKSSESQTWMKEQRIEEAFRTLDPKEDGFISRKEIDKVLAETKHVTL